MVGSSRLRPLKLSTIRKMLTTKTLGSVSRVSVKLVHGILSHRELVISIRASRIFSRRTTNSPRAIGIGKISIAMSVIALTNPFAMAIVLIERQEPVFQDLMIGWQRKIIRIIVGSEYATITNMSM